MSKQYVFKDGNAIGAHVDEIAKRIQENFDELYSFRGSATDAELSFAADVSAQTETLVAPGAVSVLLKNTNLELVASGGAVTLATPNAIMAGQIKTIRMTVDNGDVTMALTNVNNVAGASAGTTCTFDAVGDTIILAPCGAKWVVIGISGAAIT